MLILFVVLICVIILAYCLSALAPKLGLMAYPGEHRLHQEATPIIGGIAMFVGISIGIILLDQHYLNLLPSLFLLCSVGVIDDRYKLPSWIRFVAQALSAYIMIKLTGVQLTSLGYLLTDAELILGIWSTPLTIFAVIGVINAINMSDGLDGLAGSLTVLVLIMILKLSSELYYITAITIAATLGFLFWNLRVARQQAKLFMGDAGSTMLGLIIACLLIQLTQAPLMLVPPVTALWLLTLPLFDAVAVLIIRPIRGRSPFSADNTHYHHIIQARGLSVNFTLVIILIFQTTLMLLGIFMLQSGITEGMQLLVFILCFAGYIFVIQLEIKNHLYNHKTE